MWLDVFMVLIWQWKPGGFLDRCWPSVCVGILKKLDLLSAKGYSCYRIRELTSESEGKQAKSKNRFSVPSSLCCHQTVPRTNGLGPPTSNILINKVLQRAPSSLSHSWFQSRSNWPPDDPWLLSVLWSIPVIVLSFILFDFPGSFHQTVF